MNPFYILLAMATAAAAQFSSARYIKVEEADGRITHLQPIPEAAPPRWARDVSKTAKPWPPSAGKPFFSGPIRYVLPPEDATEPFLTHNHQPSVTWLGNGDLLAIWYTTKEEQGGELTVLASRLRAGAEAWDPSACFFKSADRNMHGSAIYHDGDGTVHHLNGMAPAGARGWAKLALLHRTSKDHGVTWSPPRALGPVYQGRQQVISGTIRTRDGTLVQPCDAVPGGHGGTALHISRDGGNTWNDPGVGKPAPDFKAGGTGQGTIAGIHAGVVELSDGRWMALGRGDSIDGQMPMSISADSGKSWTYSASPFPPIGGGQRLVLLRLREGPLLLVSFTCTGRENRRTRGMDFTRADGTSFRGFGLFAAISEDDGKSWPVRKLITPGSGTFDGGAWTGKFTATPDNAEHAGYLTATQTPDGTIHLLSSALHYRFNLSWIRTHAQLVAEPAAQVPPPKPKSQVPPPPGTVIHHSPASSGLYVGSPSICILADGSYLACHDLFGPKSQEHQLSMGRLYRSTDKGATWRHLHDFEGFFWTGLFVHRDAVFMLGLDKHHGRILIRRSTDFGKTWTPPAVLAEGQWHTAPVPVVEHAGRLWRAIEDAENGTKWGERYRARMMSAPVDSDLMDAKNWTISNPLARDATWLDHDFAAWLEGNAVADPQGGMLNILRVDLSRLPEKAAIVRISEDGGTATFDPGNGFVDFPGGAKKFTIRKDPQGGGYWSLATIIPDLQAGGGRPASIRNTLALVHSKDLRVWEIRSILLHHPDVVKHGFQYVDWQFEGNDIIAACRTAWDDAEGGARNNHDANFLTFHRWKNFRQLTRRDDVPMPGLAGMVHEEKTFRLRGSAFEFAKLGNGELAFSNRTYRWHDVPPELEGARFTRLAGGERPVLEITAKEDLVVRIAINPAAVDLTGWVPVDAGFGYDDALKSRLRLFSRPLKKGETVRLPRGNWTGGMLVLPP